MRFILSGFLLCLLLSCDRLQEKHIASDKAEDTSLRKDVIVYQLFDCANGYGFNILKNGKIYIHQPFVPTWDGLQTFKSKVLAEKVASYIALKLRTNNFRFLLEKPEIDSLMKTQINIKIDVQTPGKSEGEMVFQPADGISKHNNTSIKPLEKPPLKFRWRELGIVPFGKRGGGMSFSIGNNIFIGGGENKDLSASDFWSYYTVGDYWTCLAEIPSGRRISGIAFSIADKGYLGLGAPRGGNSNSFNNDFYQYDPQKNSWTKKRSFPGRARVDATAFVIADKGYAGLGYNEDYFADIYEYDPLNDSWERIADFPGGPISASVGISTHTKGFIVCGDRVPNNRRFNYEYVSQKNKWQKKMDIPGKARYFAAGYAIDDEKFIVGCGGTDGGEARFRDFYLYNVDKNSWSQIPDYPVSNLGNSRPCGGSSNGKIFLGTGYNGSFLNDWNVFEYYYNVRTDIGDYNEATSYPLKYNGQWQLFQECNRDNCFAGVELKSSQQLGNFGYSSLYAKKPRTILLKEEPGKKIFLFPRNFAIKTDNQPTAPVSLRLFFTKDELETALNDYNKKTGLINTFNDLQILQCTEKNPDTDPFNNSLQKNTYSLIKPHWYSYGYNGETLVAEFPVTSLHSEFYLVLSSK